MDFINAHGWRSYYRKRGKMSRTTIEKLQEMIAVADAVTSQTTDTSLWHTWRERSETLREISNELHKYRTLLNDLNDNIPDWQDQVDGEY